MNGMQMNAFSKCKTHQHLIHDSSKFCEGILQTKWQKLPLVQIILPMGINPQKCCLNLIALLQWQLTVVKP
jgi:hypothetical protein